MGMTLIDAAQAVTLATFSACTSDTFWAILASFSAAVSPVS